RRLTPLATGPSAGVGPATGFELTSRDQPNAANIESARERNRAFAAAGGHEGAVVFPNLRLFVITCLDPRVDPAHFLGLAPRDVERLRSAPAIAPRIRLSGHVYDVVTGLMETVITAVAEELEA